MKNNRKNRKRYAMRFKRDTGMKADITPELFAILIRMSKRWGFDIMSGMDVEVTPLGKALIHGVDMGHGPDQTAYQPITYDTIRKVRDQIMPLIGCQDCRKEIDGFCDDYYMLKDELWAQYGCGKGQICWDCMEKRLGRPIAASDLNDSMLNRCINRRAMKVLGIHSHITMEPQVWISPAYPPRHE